ncbi:nucleic acid dioxygenase ALKBH1 [Epargyreus clarus]|uniref:nucleic acid dioxygenase ALKBH1 n=1 Tax=Epargyreus clarus TaxID=520877 RepID=UPI003C2AD90C
MKRKLNNMESAIPAKGEDIFMKVFKYYKSNNQKPSYDNVISIARNTCTTELDAVNVNSSQIDDARLELLGLHKCSEWKQYSFKRHPGLILIKNPFTGLGQRYWIRQCLEEYPKKPNKKNIDIDTDLSDWWQECYKDGQLNRKLQKKLRWTTLGYHHDWDSKVYSEENKSPFPKDLAELCDVVALYLNYKNFKAEAAIVNYYHMGSTLSAHTDHSEVNLEAPLFSFSFGQSAIFLLGGHEKSTEPSAILLDSGDIVVMSKEARLCYHAVPKILPASSRPWDQSDFKPITCNGSSFKYIDDKDYITLVNRNSDNTEWKDFSIYTEESRININVRQVLNENQSTLTDSNFNDT